MNNYTIYKYLYRAWYSRLCAIYKKLILLGGTNLPRKTVRGICHITVAYDLLREGLVLDDKTRQDSDRGRKKSEKPPPGGGGWLGLGIDAGTGINALTGAA
ncbi:MAG: hypothetical protein OQK40_05175 [Gammaproteobacteria bacterium]|nr:hypothetical protein [Gammaproteobacteria bacterium]